MTSSSIMRLVLVVTIVFLVQIEGTTHQSKSSHYSGRRILSSSSDSEKKSNDNYNNYLDQMKSNFYSSSGGNRRLDPYNTDTSDLDIQSNSNNDKEILGLNSWDNSQHYTVPKYYEDEDTSSEYNSLYYEPSYSPAVQESSWPYSTYYTEAEKTTSTPSSSRIPGYYESSSTTSFPFYSVPTYGQRTEVPSINPNESVALIAEENSIDTDTVLSKIRKTIKNMAANIGLCTGSWVGCFICVGTFGGLPTLGPLPYSCITSCSLGIFTNCARFDLFSHLQG